jgi:hypothetical protein
MNIKLFTMVKDEVDIIREWILYHGYLFGFNNLFIVDNFSTDGTFEEINKFASVGVNIFREKDYKQKGIIMTTLIKTHCHNEIAYPLDIDEFVVHYNKDTKCISVDKTFINNYINNLPKTAIYKTNYIIGKITVNDDNNNFMDNITCGIYVDYGNAAKSFFNSQLFNGEIDHGNHFITNNYHLTELCLIHYHHRSLNQMKKKIYNNIVGLGYDINNVNRLRNLISKNAPGKHHIKAYIEILENKYNLPVSGYDSLNDCLLVQLTELINIFKMFDWIYYLDTYLDLRENGVSTLEQALQHWMNHGKKEGRLFSIFNWQNYLDWYPDLRQNGIHTPEQAFQHWITCGQMEGRQSSIFDWQFYLDKYPDLRQNGICNAEQAIEHWLNCGRKEGRNE